MKIRKVVLGGALVVIVVPIALVLLALASVSVLDRSNGVIVSSGEERAFLLYVPASYDRTKPTPLVISLHAAALWPAHQMNTSRWNRLADEHGFIVVYPAGSGVPRIWRAQPGEDPMVDVRFISELIDTLAASYNIDPTRIYANGLSNGGGMTFVLSCALSARLAAVGTVAAAQALPWSWCTTTDPVPLIAFHGTADPVVPYDGGTSWASPKPFPGVLTWTENWARRNRCKPNPVESAVAADVTRLEYADLR